jgi:hypothetical protein
MRLLAVGELANVVAMQRAHDADLANIVSPPRATTTGLASLPAIPAHDGT